MRDSYYVTMEVRVIVRDCDSEDYARLAAAGMVSGTDAFSDSAELQGLDIVCCTREQEHRDG